jgi:hypothetical protein
MATDQRYGNTGSSGGNGTTNATSGANAAYASMSSWEANSGGSATDDYIVDMCGTAADTTAVNVDFAVNITTGSVLVRCNRSDGAGFYTGNLVISTSHYRLDPGNVADALRLSEANCTVDGIQVISGHTVANGNAIRVTAGSSVVNCRALNTSSCDYGIGSSGSVIGTNNSARVYTNNLVVGFDVAGIDVRVGANRSPACTVHHNTVYGDGSSVGIRLVAETGSGTPTFSVKGNAVDATSCLDVSGVVVGTITYADNALSAAHGTTDEIVLGTTTDAWTSPGTSASSDFSVKNTSSSLYNAVNPTLLSTDITGFTRDGTNHDVGSFEYRSTGYSMTAGSGSYTLTGQSAGLRPGRSVSAAQGSYTITGHAANLLRGLPLSAAQGSYLLSGQAAALALTRALSALQGTYSLSGQGATLLAGRQLAGGQGSYELAGQDASLNYTPAGAFTLSASYGTYVLTGQAAGLFATRRAVADQGTYSISGQAAALSRGLSMAAGQGAYALTGQAATLLRTWAMAADYGSYGLTGQSVTLTYSDEAAPPVLASLRGVADGVRRTNDVSRAPRIARGRSARTNGTTR